MRLLILYFACLLCRRGRTRGRVVLDEEDSMDGTEVAESIGPLDTGETLKLLFFFIHYVRVGHVASDVRTQPAHPAAASRKVSFLSKVPPLKEES